MSVLSVDLAYKQCQDVGVVVLRTGVADLLRNVASA